MKISQAFPSNYLKAEDLNGQNVTIIIDGCELVEIGQGRDKEQKLLLSFRGKEKKLVCNKTNANTIAKLYGDDTDNWIGQKITIGVRDVDFQGSSVAAIRVSAVKPVQQAASKPAPAPIAPPPQPPQPEAGADDQVPF